MISGGDRKMATAFSNADRAEVLTQALPYFKKYYGKINFNFSTKGE